MDPQKVTIDGQAALAYEIDETGHYVTCRFVGYGKYFLEAPENVVGLDLKTLPRVR